MKTLIALNGRIADRDACARIAASCGRVVCADGGARHLRDLDIVPDLLVGDLDSIDEASLSWMENRGVRILRYSAEKDWTDSELALNAALENAGSPGDEIWMIGAVGDRLDHVLANLGMAAMLAARGLRAWLTDGVAYITYMKGPDILRIDLDEMRLTDPVVSVVPAAGLSMTGVTLEGLVYPLQNATLKPGSTRGVSNRVLSGRKALAVEIASGEGYVTLMESDC